MIAELTGSVSYKGTTFAVINVGGVGYKVFSTQDTLDKLDIDTSGKKSISLKTYLAVRENALDLYGFLDQEHLHFFELLITISGIGPKTALSILNVASVRTLRSAITTNNPDHLSKISGIGKKNAEKIVLELGSKVVSDGDAETDAEVRDESDVIEALKGLGYSERDAREALKKIDKKLAVGASAGEKIKRALKILAQ